MNGIDVILGALFLISSIGGLILSVIMFKDDEIDAGLFILVMAGTVAFFTGATFVVVDRGSGVTMGEITSVDKNYFGTTAVYIKTSETEQEKYCIEDDFVAAQAKEYIGKKVKISYGERVGIYSTGKCSQAPVTYIEEIFE